MVAGGIAAGIAFLASGILELQLEKTYPQLPGKGHAALNCINTLPCAVIVKNDQYEARIGYGEMVNFRYKLIHKGILKNLLPRIEPMLPIATYASFPNKTSIFCFRHILHTNLTNYLYIIEAPRNCAGLTLLRNKKSVLVTLEETEVVL